MGIFSVVIKLLVVVGALLLLLLVQLPLLYTLNLRFAVFKGCTGALVASDEKLIKLLLLVAETIFGLLEEIVGVIV